MNFFENITLRRTRTKSDSNTVTNETINSTFEDTNTSLPDLSNDDITDVKQQQITKLKDQIDKLVLDLNSAHQEIESLSLENSHLKQVNLDLQRKNDLLTKLNSPIKKLKKSTPLKKTLNKNKGTQTETLMLSNKENDKTSPSVVQNKTIRNEAKSPQISQSKNDSKICILSTNNKNDIVNIAKQTLQKHSVNICHYIKTHCNTQQLVHDIETKLETFTMKDFCIILIGEEDFKTTCDYLQLTLHLRATLQKVNFTNIIICTPTFSCNYHRNMYNWRVEHLNNLLYLDTLTYEHAYLLDSNKNLTFDLTMFTKLGLINDHGMRTIFKDIDEFIDGIKKYDLLMTDDDLIPDNQQLETQFFL